MILPAEISLGRTDSEDFVTRLNTMDGSIGKLAAEFETKKLEESKCLQLNAVNDTLLENLLREIVYELQPTEKDLYARMDILQRLTALVGQIDNCKAATVVPFGSFESDLYTPWGDLDICLVVPFDPSAPVPKNKRLRVLRSVQEALLHGGGASRIQVLSQPRVPLLMFEDTYWKISCDISVNNSAAIIKSRILRWISNIDPRCRQLVFLVKCWAKAQCINDPKMGTLNSYALCLLVVFHLQSRQPPILPPLNTVISERLLHGPDTVDEVELKQCLRKIQELTSQGYGRTNTCSISELFLSFFVQFSAVEDLWLKGLAVCTFSGKWGDRTTTDRGWAKKGYVMMVEDPFDLSDNCARSVHESSLQLICKAFSLTSEILYNSSSYLLLSTMREMLFCWPYGHRRPRLHSHSYDPKPGIQQLQEYVVFTMSRMTARIKKRDMIMSQEAKRREASNGRHKSGVAVAGRRHGATSSGHERGETKGSNSRQQNPEQAASDNGEVEQLADGIASTTVGDTAESLETRRGNRTDNNTSRKHGQEEADPQLDILLSIRNLFHIPKRRRRRRRWGPKPKRAASTGEQVTNGSLDVKRLPGDSVAAPAAPASRKS